ncbi:MAG: HEAT repeat domain-containing protein [Fimbriimonadaceae bacterium]|nr:HEAT repeat domain-containing protein [Fimbriimonadaceae bacterium]
MRLRGNESLIANALTSDSDPTIRAYAAGTLGRLGGPEAIRALRLALADADLEVRVLSTAALLSLGQSVDEKIGTQVDAEAKARGMLPAVQRLSLFQR